MNVKYGIISIFLAVIVLLVGLTPALASDKNNLQSERDDLVTIEVNQFLGPRQEQIRTTVPAGDAEEIRYYLTELYNAQEKGDSQAVSFYESLLLEKGIFGRHNQMSGLKNTAKSALWTLKHPFPTMNMVDDNISNRLCYFNAIGEGIVLWWLSLQVLEGITKIIKNASNFFEAFILLLVFLPFLVLTMVFTNLIPFRILAPTGALAVKNGSISCLGLNGFQRVTVGAESYGVNLSWFTGITINILPTENRSAFLFVSGTALKAEGIDIR